MATAALNNELNGRGLRLSCAVGLRAGLAGIGGLLVVDSVGGQDGGVYSSGKENIVEGKEREK